VGLPWRADSVGQSAGIGMDITMLTITLYGTPSCRRYQKMHKLVVDAAARLNLPILVTEISETAQLIQFSPLSLPRLYINDKLVASQNPPKVEQITKVLEQEKA
jgi:hypothetical protein